MPLTEIAKKVGLNKDVVRYRIEKLEKEKVILGYYALIDTHKLGYLTIRIYKAAINKMIATIWEGVRLRVLGSVWTSLYLSKNILWSEYNKI